MSEVYSLSSGLPALESLLSKGPSPDTTCRRTNVPKSCVSGADVISPQRNHVWWLGSQFRAGLCGQRRLAPEPPQSDPRACKRQGHQADLYIRLESGGIWRSKGDSREHRDTGVSHALFAKRCLADMRNRDTPVLARSSYGIEKQIMELYTYDYGRKGLF